MWILNRQRDTGTPIGVSDRPIGSTECERASRRAWAHRWLGLLLGSTGQSWASAAGRHKLYMTIELYQDSAVLMG